MGFGTCSSVDDIWLSITAISTPGMGDLDAGGNSGGKLLLQLFPECGKQFCGILVTLPPCAKSVWE